MVLNLALQGLKKSLKSLKFHDSEPIETLSNISGPPSTASSITSVLPASTPRSVASIASAQFESDEETFESDVLSRPAVTKKKSLHEAVKEKVSWLHTML